MANKTRHGVPADDSDLVSVVVPKQLKERCRCIAFNTGTSISDAIRRCIVEGACKIERKLNEE